MFALAVYLICAFVFAGVLLFALLAGTSLLFEVQHRRRMCRRLRREIDDWPWAQITNFDGTTEPW